MKNLILIILLLISINAIGQVSKYTKDIPILTPTPSIDNSSLYQALSKKQAQYDANFIKIQQKINDVASKIEVLREIDNNQYNLAQKQFNKVIQWLNSSDISDSKVIYNGSAYLDDVSYSVINAIKGGNLSFKYKFN
jgi:TolA-binding protein